MRANFLIQLVMATLLVSSLPAQDLGKVTIRNGSEAYPKFIVSLNGIRLNNDYSHSVAFDYLDEYTYKVRVLQAGSAKPLSFMLNSAPKYISKYIISQDSYGNYSLILESKALVGSQSEAPAVGPATVAITNSFTSNGPQPMSDADYQGVLKAVKKESFENGKLDMAKTFFGTPSQSVSSEQVLGVLKLFSFENNKLSFAKFAYTYTHDKQNYYKVFDALSFSNSKKELTEYINKK